MLYVGVANLYCLNLNLLQNSAQQFYTEYDGHPFNSIESTLCRLVFVQRIEMLRSGQMPVTPSPDLVELPSCPVCLERLVSSLDKVVGCRGTLLICSG